MFNRETMTPQEEAIERIRKKLLASKKSLSYSLKQLQELTDLYEKIIIKQKELDKNENITRRR